MPPSSSFPALFDRVKTILPTPEVYLVGGAIRDALLGIETRDLDFTMPSRAVPSAREVADQLGGAFYVLDEEREAARVVFLDQDHQRHILDFTQFQGESIEEDLRARDFTITAVAVPVDEPQRLIDPLGGISDLRRGIIRACTDQALQDDPLRVMRGIRMAAQYEFRIEEGTKALIKQGAPLLTGVSPERRRDEFFQILGGPHADAALGSLSLMGIYPYLLPGFGDLTRRRGRRVRYLHQLWDLLGQEHDPEGAASWAMGLSVLRLGRYREQIQEHMQGALVPGRSLLALITFAALVLPEGSEPDLPCGTTAEVRDHARNLRLSVAEIGRLGQMLDAYHRFQGWSVAGSPPTAREIYRFFQGTSAAGVDGIFLGLCDILARHGAAAPLDRWPQALDVARAILEAWWEKRDQIVSPPALVTGHDLMDRLNLDAGPGVGSLLAQIREEQAAGNISSQEEALAFARSRLQNSLGGGE